MPMRRPRRHGGGMAEVRQAGRKGKASMTNPHLKQELMEVIENQLRDGDPPETRQTLNRLLEAGYAPEAAMPKVAVPLLEEINEMLAQRIPFNHARFKQRLDHLS